MTSEEFTNAHPALAQFWHPVALSAEVGREPVAGRLGGQGWALARFGGGIAAFADACPHRRARLSAGQVTDGTLQCLYHGWRFTPDGRCVDIPALEDTASIPERATLRRPAKVAEQDGMVWLAPEPPRAPIPELHPGVPLAGGGIATVILPVLRVEANAAILIDNFLDADGWQFLTFTVAPEDERACRVYQTVTGPGLTDPEQAESTAKYEMSIFDEDLDLQRRALSGLEFPLDVAAELHTRADRISVEFRRVLAAAVSG